MKKRKATSRPARVAAPPLPGLQQAARGLLLALAVALPLVGGKLADWQTGLVALVSVLAAGLFAAGSLWPGGRSWGTRRPEDWALTALLVLMAASIFWAPYVHGAVLAVLQVLSYALCFWVARAVLGEGRWGEALAGALALGGSIVALIALREYLQTWRPGGLSEWRVFATFFNPNLVAGYLLVGLPAGVALVGRYWTGPAPEGEDSPGSEVSAPSGARKRRRDGRDAGTTGNWARPLALTAVVLMALALPLTGSKGGALGTLAAGITFGWTYAPAGTAAGRRARRWVLVGVAGVLALGLLAPPLRSRVVAAFGAQSNSAMFRYYTWAGMVRMIRARPLDGFGAGSFVLAYPRYAQTGFTRLGHQSYLQVATEAGLPALAAFLALWLFLMRGLKRRLGEASPPCPPLPAGEGERASPPLPPLSLQERGGVAGPVSSHSRRPGEGGRGVRLLSSAALPAVIGFLVHNLVDYTWYCPAVTASLFLLLGAALAEGRADQTAAVRPSRRRPYLEVTVLALLGVALAVFLVAQVRQAAAQAALQAGDSRGAIRHAKAALQADPWDAGAWELLSDVWRYRSQTPGREPTDLLQALEARRQAARLRRTDPTNWRRLALLHAEAGDPAAGVEAVTRALKYNPNYVLGLADLARLAEQAGRPDLATDSWRRLANLYDTPIRKYAALELPDLNYLYAWDYLTRQAEKQEDRPRALAYRRRMAPLLEQVLTLSPIEKTLMQSVGLLRTGDLEALRLMADQTAAALRATGEEADAEQAARLEKARGKG